MVNFFILLIFINQKIFISIKQRKLSILNKVFLLLYNILVAMIKSIATPFIAL